MSGSGSETGALTLVDVLSDAANVAVRNTGRGVRYEEAAGSNPATPIQLEGQFRS
jgi:hypothetical protein